VVLIRPNPERRIPWRARYADPDSAKATSRGTGEPAKKPGRMVYVTLPADVTTLEQREQWAVKKSAELAKRRLELSGGAPRATGTSLSDAIDRYFKAQPQLRPRTVEAYRAAAAKLTAWAKATRLRSADDLTRAKLMAFREVLISQPKQVSVAGGKRGERSDARERRSPGRVNSEMRKVRTVLGYLIDADLFPRLARDDLRRALKRLPVTTERIEYMRAPELQQLLAAALRHDAELYAETRAEHAGEGRQRIGSTPRYDSMSAFVAFVLLTGCRFGEALALEWA